MRAYIAVVLLTAGFVAPALAATAPTPVNVQQPDGERATQAQRQKAARHAAAVRAAQAKQTPAKPAAAARTSQAAGPTRIVPGTQVVPAASTSSSWSSSMLSWWRGESVPAGAGQGTAAEVSAEPAAARVETTATPEPVKPTRRKARRARSSDPTATGAVPDTAQAEAKVEKAEKPVKSKRRPAKRSRPRDRQVAARASTGRQAERSRDTVPEPRPKPTNSAAQHDAPQTAADSAVGSISPAEVKENGASQMAALSSQHDASGGEATWWQRQGNPVVFNFRDCVASYASREAQRNKDGTWADLLIRATEGDCRAPFDEMARTLAKRFGETRIEPVMRELIDTTFLPAAKQAAAESAPASPPASAQPSSEVPPLPPIPDSVPTQ